MTILDRLLHPGEARTTLRDPDGWLIESFTGGSRSLSGQIVSPQNATGVSAYYACMRVVAEDVGKLPFPLYERLKPRGKNRLVDHPLYRLIHDDPNPEMSSQTFRETLTAHAFGWGNGFAEIVWKRGRPVALWPLDPSTVRVEREGESRMLVYKVRHSPSESEVTLPARDMFHLHGLGFDGLTGYSVAKIAKQTLGLAMALEKFGASYFGRGGKPSGRLEFPHPVKPERIPALRKQFEDVHEGEEGWHKTLVLEDGATWKPYSYPHDDAQWIESRNFGVEDIARFARVPPHKIGHLLRATYSNISEQNQEYTTDTLLPILSRWSHEVRRKLIPREQHGHIFAEHLIEGLLHGNPEQQSKLYAAGRQWGWFSANDVLELMNRNPLPGDEGDVYLSPVNMVPADQLDNTPEPTPPTVPDTEPGRLPGLPSDVEFRRIKNVDALTEAHLPQMVKAYSTLLAMEAGKAERAHKRDKLAEWAADYYGKYDKQVRGVLAESIEAFCGSLWAISRSGPMPEAASRMVASYTVDIVAEHIKQSQEHIAKNDVDGMLAHWRDVRPERDARETLRILSAAMLSILDEPVAEAATA